MHLHSANHCYCSNKIFTIQLKYISRYLLIILLKTDSVNRGCPTPRSDLNQVVL